MNKTNPYLGEELRLCHRSLSRTSSQELVGDAKFLTIPSNDPITALLSEWRKMFLASKSGLLLRTRWQ